MPQPAQQHDDRQVCVSAVPALAVAAQGNVEVIAKPGGQRNMPSSPELGDRLADVGRVEVLGEHEPHHQPQADRHVGVGRKVEVDLEGIGDGADPGVGGADRTGVEAHVRDLAAGVGQHHLLGQAHREQRYAPAELLEGVRPLAQLIVDFLKADDRPGDKLREHRHVATEVDEVADCSCIPTIDVDRVAHRLERVEADAQRQRDPKQRLPGHALHADAVRDRVPGIDTEVEILEEPQQRQVRADRDRQRDALAGLALSPLGQRLDRLRPVPLPTDEQAADIVDDRAGEHQHDEQRVGPTIEQVAEQGQHAVVDPREAHARRPLQHRPDQQRQVIPRQRQRQEVKQKKMRAEYHRIGVGFSARTVRRYWRHLAFGREEQIIVQIRQRRRASRRRS